MKYFLTILGLFIISNSINAQLKETILKYKQKPRWVLICNSETEETCKMMVYFPNGKKKGEVRVTYYDKRNRFRPNGDAMLYFDDGSIFQKYNHETGTLLTYYPTGELKEKIITPLHGEKEYEYKYYKTGQLWEEKDGMRTVGQQNLQFGHSGYNKEYIYANRGTSFNHTKTYHSNGNLKSYFFVDRDSSQFKYVRQFFSPDGLLDPNATHDRQRGRMVKNGRRYKYHPNGQLREIVDFVNDKMDGEQYWWTTKGVMIWKANYRSGSRFGKFERWWENGQRRELSYHTGVYRNGPFFRWNRDGSVLEQGSYYEGTPLSLVAIRDTFGKLAAEKFGSMEHRDINRLYDEYYAASNKKPKLKSKGAIINGLRDGEWRYYWEKKGKANKREICAIINYKNGLLHGESIIYHPNGTILLEVNFEDGWLEGDYVSKWENGYVAVKGKFKKHKKTGLWTRYFHKSAQINRIQLYENGQGLETFKEWDSDGFLKKDRVDNVAKGQVEFYDYYKSGMYLKHVRPYGAKSMHYYLYDTLGRIKETRILLADNPKNYTWTKYFPNGEPKSISTIIDNKQNGTYREWYEDSMMKSEIRFENGLRQGAAYTWDKNGQKQTTYFKNGIQSIENTAEEEALLCSCNHPPEKIESRFMSRFDNYASYDSIKHRMSYFSIPKENYLQIFNRNIHYYDRRISGTIAVFKDFFIDINNGLRLNLTPCRRGVNRAYLEFDGEYNPSRNSVDFSIRDLNMSIEFPKKLLRLYDVQNGRPLVTSIKKYEKSSVRYGLKELRYREGNEEANFIVNEKIGHGSCFQISEIGETGILLDGHQPEIDLNPKKVIPSLRSDLNNTDDEKDYLCTDRKQQYLTPSWDYLRQFMGVYFKRATLSFDYNETTITTVARNIFISGTEIYGNLEIPSSVSLSLEDLKNLSNYLEQKGFEVLSENIEDREILRLFWRYEVE